MANFWGGWTPPRHSGTWVGARVASLRCHYPPPRRSQHSRNAKARPHKSKTSCLGGHRRGTTTSGPGRGPLAGFEVTLYGRFWGDRRGRQGQPPISPSPNRRSPGPTAPPLHNLDGPVFQASPAVEGAQSERPCPFVSSEASGSKRLRFPPQVRPQPTHQVHQNIMWHTEADG